MPKGATGTEGEALVLDFGDGYLLHLARDPKVPMRIYAVSGQAEMLLSQDGGATWELVARP